MASDIGVRIGVDGEKEFKSALAAINEEMKALDSSMRLAQEEMADMADSEEAIARQSTLLSQSVEAQERKIALLSGEYDRANNKLDSLGQALREAKEQFGENSVEASKAQNAFNRQAREVSKLERQLNDAKTTMSRTQREIKNLGSEAESTGGKFTDLGDKVKGAFVGGAVLGAVSGLAGSIADLSAQSLEYNKIMGTLTVSGQQAGYAADQTSASYMQLYSIVGDQQASATAIANLQAIGLSQDQLSQMINLTTGAWLTYGDSIPIDGLAEAINETIQAGVVTGTFADALNWAGISEDDFNTKLAAANTETERANLVMEALASQGLAQTTEAWKAENEAIVASNEATAKLADATAQFGEFFTPVVTGAKNLAADFLLGIVDVGESFLQLPSYAQQAFKSVGDAITEGIQNILNLPERMLQVGIDTITSIGQGNAQQLPVLLAQEEEISGEMVNTMQGFQPDFQSTGLSLMQGVETGIDHGRSGVVNSIASALAAAVARARAEMDINSPSGVYAEIGDYMAQGLGVGFTDRMRSVTRDINKALPTVDMKANLALSGSSGSGGTVSYGDINLYIDRVDNGNGRTIETLANELEFYRRQQASARGGRE